jgi:hypothetical protein
MNSGIYVPNNALDNGEMRFLRISLESNTNFDTEGNIWSTCCKIEKTANNTYVNSRIYLLACQISTNHDACAHGSICVAFPIYTKTFHEIFGIFSLRNKDPLRGLFDLHPQKIGQLTYHTHFKLLFHFFGKLMSLRI